MKRPTLNLIVDAGAFATLLAMVSTGFLLRYILPPGSGRAIGEGTGHQSAQKSIALLWGLARHEWGEIHFWASLVLMGILAVHLFLHWRWIVCVIRNQPKEGSGMRFGLGMFGLLAILAFAVTPFISPVRQIPRYRLDEDPSQKQAPIRLREKKIISGSMTLRDVENQTGVPVDYLLEKLNLPSMISADSHLGRLSRMYGFDMEEAHEIVKHYEELQSLAP